MPGVEMGAELTRAHAEYQHRLEPIGIEDRDEREALRRGLEGGNFFGYSLAYYIVFGDPTEVR